MESKTDPLDPRVAALVAHIRKLRQAGDIATLLAAAKAAADEIEARIGEPQDEPGRQALLAVKRFTYNVAADCWPGWQVSKSPPDPQMLQTALELAERSARLVSTLNLGPIHEGTGAWLCGALELALGRYSEASRFFSVARDHYATAGAPGLVMLVEGYMAIVHQLRRDSAATGADDLEVILDRIGAGGFEDGAEWIGQLRTAQKVFMT